MVFPALVLAQGMELEIKHSLLEIFLSLECFLAKPAFIWYLGSQFCLYHVLPEFYTIVS